jgi:hypothetical protein
MTKARVSLSDYAATHTTSAAGPTAWLPSLPEWDAILHAWETNTASGAQIRSWLIHECGYPMETVTHARVAGYLSKHHPRRTNGQR